MSKLLLLFVTLLAVYPSLAVVEKYIDMNQVESFDANVNNAIGQVYELKTEASKYASPVETVELKPGVYDVSKYKTMLRKVGIYDDYVSVYMPSSPLSYDYAYNVFSDVIDNVMTSVNKSREVLNATIDLIVNITKTYGNETIDDEELAKILEQYANITNPQSG
jgi:hypothetical protein